MGAVGPCAGGSDQAGGTGVWGTGYGCGVKGQAAAWMDRLSC
jgi:hypothetical protein